MWMDFECETLFLAKTREARQHVFIFLIPWVYWMRE
jgi:hypothetical protein